MDNDSFFEQKMNFGLQKTINEITQCFSQSRWMSTMEQFDQTHKGENQEYVPASLKSQHARTFLIQVQSILKDHITKEITDRVNKTQIKKQLEFLQNSQVARQCLTQTNIPIEDRDLFFQDQINFDDQVQDSILTMLQNDEIKD